MQPSKQKYNGKIMIIKKYIFVVLTILSSIYISICTAHCKHIQEEELFTNASAAARGASEFVHLNDFEVQGHHQIPASSSRGAPGYAPLSNDIEAQVHHQIPASSGRGVFWEKLQIAMCCTCLASIFIGLVYLILSDSDGEFCASCAADPWGFPQNRTADGSVVSGL